MEHVARGPLWTLTQQVQDKTGPEQKPRRSPVFIQDAVTPWGGETLLLALLRAQQEGTDQDE